MVKQEDPKVITPKLFLSSSVLCVEEENVDADILPVKWLGHLSHLSKTCKRQTIDNSSNNVSC